MEAGGRGLTPLDFSGIPEHAVRKEGVSIQVTPENPAPWSIPISRENGRVIAHYDAGEIDITDAWDAWTASQPQVHSVTFTWTETPINQETETA